VHDRLSHVPLNVLLLLCARGRDALKDRLKLHRHHLLQFSCQSLYAYKTNFAKAQRKTLQKVYLEAISRQGKA